MDGSTQTTAFQPAIMNTPNRQLSFEFSAPRSPEALTKVIQVYDKLSQFNPEFFSVTYGAGGSTKSGTLDTVLALNNRAVPVAPHLSFGDDSETTIGELLETYRAAGIKRIVALRGDAPSGTGTPMHYANELVAFIRARTGDHFHIEVAAYPEYHPESASVEQDLYYFKLKVDAGANSAITQYFYNADAYFRYVDQCASHGLQLPIVPGIMPITNYEGLKRFSDNCGAEIPRWICRQLESYGDDRQSIGAFGEEVVTQLCERLLSGGAPGLHLYTMNLAGPSSRICQNLNL